MMSLYGKYAMGILFSFVLLAAVMLYSFPLIYCITGIKGLTSAYLFYSRIILWVVLALVFLYNLFIEKNSFLLWKEKQYSVMFYLKAVIILYLICAFGGSFLNFIIQVFTHENVSRKLVRIASLLKNNYFLIVSICLTAGIVEELLMRGYIQPRIEKIYNNPYPGIFISAVLFGILHSTYGTLGQVLVPFFIGTVFAVFYKKYSNIKILIICHFMYDFVSMMIMNFIDIKHLSAF
ncbi:CPBP family intramembrane glutamic endopeptidase [Chryseobacterium shigense]|uniref:Membrane protease YdiL (CAAX protease family) n=1 Tax=Chryseobacterium shigense TaxID=297244 RepID=A0A841NAA7_9FLAO|nr:type II CAAX endopeptidase family protein [Chryseobacterium shigense]MBB6370310.1 membrane protease YdiL (CAAX protease family) [Chryseobacterium shigense]